MADRNQRLLRLMQMFKPEKVDPSAAQADSVAVSTERAIDARTAGQPIATRDSLRLVAAGKGKFMELPEGKPIDYSAAYTDSLAMSRGKKDAGEQLTEGDMSRLERAGEAVTPKQKTLDELTYTAKLAEMRNKLWKQDAIHKSYAGTAARRDSNIAASNFRPKEEKPPAGTEGTRRYTAEIQKNVNDLAKYMGVDVNEGGAPVPFKAIMKTINKKLEDGRVPRDAFVEAKLGAIQTNQDSLQAAASFKEAGISNINEGFQYKEIILVALADFQKKLLEFGFDQEKAAEWLQNEYGLTPEELLRGYNAVK